MRGSGCGSGSGNTGWREGRITRGPGTPGLRFGVAEHLNPMTAGRPTAGGNGSD
jgi:hypothetical protein